MQTSFLMSLFADCVLNLFVVLERPDQLIQRIEEIENDPEFADSIYTPILLSLSDDLSEEDELHYSLGLLVAALFGEVWPEVLPSEAFQADEASASK